jgi:hypothetical protein
VRRGTHTAGRFCANRYNKANDGAGRQSLLTRRARRINKKAPREDIRGLVLVGLRCLGAVPLSPAPEMKRPRWGRHRGPSQLRSNEQTFRTGWGLGGLGDPARNRRPSNSLGALFVPDWLVTAIRYFLQHRKGIFAPPQKRRRAVRALLRHFQLYRLVRGWGPRCVAQKSGPEQIRTRGRD